MSGQILQTRKLILCAVFVVLADFWIGSGVVSVCVDEITEAFNVFRSSGLVSSLRCF